jgi:uncharacterized protein (TIGR00304 family)
MNLKELGVSMGIEMLYGFGIVLVISGLAVILIATLALFFSNVKEEGETKGGGVIIIGPIPIVAGTDIESIKTILLISTVLTIILFVIMVAYYLMSR